MEWFQDVASPGSRSFGARRAQAKPASSADDAMLVRAALTGDVRAPREIWRRYLPLVRSIVHRALTSEHEAEEVIQDVFLTLFDKLPVLRDPNALRAFLVSISSRSVRHALRRRRIRRIVILRPTFELAELYGVPSEVESRQALHHLRTFLQRLPVREGAVFALRFIEGCELQDTAAALDVSVPTVRRALSRACARLASLACEDAFLTPYLMGRVGEARSFKGRPSARINDCPSDQ